MLILRVSARAGIKDDLPLIMSGVLLCGCGGEMMGPLNILGYPLGSNV
jgi:hypothetical protein